MQITAAISIPEEELQEIFVTSPGPGGQHVNRSATATQLRFDLAANTSLPPDLKQRLQALAGNRLTSDGMLIIQAHCHRSQYRNRLEARERLQALVQRAAQRPKNRTKTKPTKASQRRRVEQKKQHGQTKRMRQNPTSE